MIYTLTDKAYKLSDECFYKDNINKIKSFLHTNSYPSKFVDFYIRKRLSYLKKLKDNNKSTVIDINQQINQQKMNLYNSYNNNLFYKVKNAFKKYPVNVIAKPQYSLSNTIIRGKDKLDKFKQPNKVYQINCKNCDVTYVGEAKRELGKRIKYHIDNIKLNPSKHSVLPNIEIWGIILSGKTPNFLRKK